MGKAYITDLKYRRHGMAMFPFNTIRRLSDDEFEIGTSTEEFTWDAIESVPNTPFDTCYLDAPEDPFSDMHSSRTVASLDDIAKLSDALEEAGLRNMDGYERHRDLGPGVLDGGDGFRLAVVFSDGTTLASSSTNAYPPSYAEVSRALLEFFEEHADFSRRYPRQVPDSPIVRLCIECGSMFGGENSAIPYIKFELDRVRSQWAVAIYDNYGQMFDEKVKLSDFASVDNPDSELPFDEMMEMVAGIDVVGDNPTQTGSGDGIENLLIQVRFANGQEILYNTNMLPDGYEGFKDDIARFAFDYHRSMTTRS